MNKSDYKFSLMIGVLCFLIGYMINTILSINDKEIVYVPSSNTYISHSDTIVKIDSTTLSTDTIKYDSINETIGKEVDAIENKTLPKKKATTNPKKKNDSKQDIIDTMIVVYDDILEIIPDSAAVNDTISIIDNISEEIDTYEETHQMTYEEEFIETIVNEDTICGVYIFNDNNGYITKIPPSPSKKCKVKKNNKKRFVTRQILDAKYDESFAYHKIDSGMHIIICFNDNLNEDEMFKNVENITNINIHRLTVKKNRREMHSDITYYGGGISVSNSSVSFDTKVIGEGMIELVLPSNISPGEYAISYDSYQNQPNKKTTHNIFAFSI